MDNPSNLKISLPLQDCDLDLRDAFFDEFNKKANLDRNVILLTDDQDAFSLTWLRQNLPEQYFHAGIAEQNLISVAAGLALGGKTPVVYGIAAFMTMRCFEQIRDDVCFMNLPVTIVASGGGFGYSGDGPTHHATQDVAIMRSLPNISVFSPSDAVSTIYCAEIACLTPGAKYIRIEKGLAGQIYPNNHDFSPGLGVLSDGSDLTIISTGIMTHNALQIADELKQYTISTRVIDLYRLKPVDPAILLSAIDGTPRIVTLEEHSIIGGLGSLISEIITDSGSCLALKRIGIPDEFHFIYGSRGYLQARAGLDNEVVLKEILKWMERD